MSTDNEDEALIAAALQGSAVGWEKLVKRHESRIYNLGLRLTGNRSDAMDLMQEVFLGVYRNLHRFRGDARFSSWLFRIAHNKAIDLNRRKRILSAGGSLHEDESDPDSYPAATPDEPHTRLQQRQQNDRIRALLSQLPFDQRLIVELKIYQSQTFEEIARTQDISENTAKTRFYTALRKLKPMTEKDYDLS